MDIQAIAFRVAQRFFQSDNRFRPPKEVVNGVDIGELDPQVLLIWKYTVERLGDKFKFPAAYAYWRNKCAKEGINLPAAYLKGGEGATHGAFKVKNGDQIEEWVKERLESEGLASSTQRTAEEWKLEISHLQSMVDDAKDRIAKHEKGLAEGNRVNQRVKWLADAKKDLESGSKDLEKAMAAVEALQETLEKHEDVVAPVIDFEKQFQLMLHQASNDLAKREVLAQAKRALAKFEEEMSTPKFAAEGPDSMWSLLVRKLDRFWDLVQAAFAKLGDWVDDLTSSTKRLDKLVESVG